MASRRSNRERVLEAITQQLATDSARELGEAPGAARRRRGRNRHAGRGAGERARAQIARAGRPARRRRASVCAPSAARSSSATSSPHYGAPPLLDEHRDEVLRQCRRVRRDPPLDRRALGSALTRAGEFAGVRGLAACSTAAPRSARARRDRASPARPARARARWRDSLRSRASLERPPRHPGDRPDQPEDRRRHPRRPHPHGRSRRRREPLHPLVRLALGHRRADRQPARAARHDGSIRLRRSASSRRSASARRSSRRASQVDTLVLVIPARCGRRRAGDEGRHHGDRRHLRHQQGRHAVGRRRWRPRSSASWR